VVTATVAVLASTVVAANIASAAGGPPSIAAGPAFGYVPSQNANHAGHGGGGHVMQLAYHGGPVQTSGTDVYAVYWGSSWGGTTFSQTQTGLDGFYKGVGGSGYANSNTEYTDGFGVHVSPSVTFKSDTVDLSATPSGAPSTSQVLTEVANATHGNVVKGAYYPVYSDQPRGSAGYCAWHSSGTINGTQVQFGFFFWLAGDPGCDPQDSSTGHSQALAALGNVSGHELSEMLTDPQLNAWYDQRGNENADKCAWTFGSLVSLGASGNWKIQGNWSNAAALTNSWYGGTVGCIETG
jgi:hypothetical protein